MTIGKSTKQICLKIIRQLLPMKFGTKMQIFFIFCRQLLFLPTVMSANQHVGKFLERNYGNGDVRRVLCQHRSRSNVRGKRSTARNKPRCLRTGSHRKWRNSSHYRPKPIGNTLISYEQDPRSPVGFLNLQSTTIEANDNFILQQLLQHFIHYVYHQLTGPIFRLGD